MEPRPFEHLFGSATPERDKSLSRLFGPFSEELVRHWCRLPGAVYEDLGMPTLQYLGRRSTLDFTLRRRTSGQVFVAEMKCELEFDGYRYLRLTSSSQLEHHGQPAFQALLAVASAPHSVPVAVAGRLVTVDGAVLIWGATSPTGTKAVIERHGFADVLSVEAILADLGAASGGVWRARVAELRGWSDELFAHLADLRRTDGRWRRSNEQPWPGAET